MRSLPPNLAAADPRVVRPRDASEVFAAPSKELRDLERQGALLRLAHGYYAIVPEARRHAGDWLPTSEAAALAIAQADYGRDGAALMGMSAARLHGAIPRALRGGVVAVGKQRPALETPVGQVTFVTRDVGGLDVEHHETELADGWVTTVEQTLVDLVDRPTLGGLPCADAVAAARALAVDADRTRVVEIAGRLRKAAAMRTLEVLWAGGEWEPAVTRRC